MPDRTVELRVPAAEAYVSLLRTAAAAVAARLDFTLDRLEDLKLAVDEAAALLIPDPSDGELVARFTPYDDDSGLQVAVTATGGSRARVPRPGTFAWTVLTALVDEVAVDTEADGVTLVLRAGRDLAVRR